MANTPENIKPKITPDASHEATPKVPETPNKNQIDDKLKQLETAVTWKSQEQIVQKTKETIKSEKGLTAELASTEKNLETAYGKEHKEIQSEWAPESGIEKSKIKSPIPNKLIPNKPDVPRLRWIAADATKTSVQWRINANNNLVNEMIKAPWAWGRLFKFFGIKESDKIT